MDLYTYDEFDLNSEYHKGMAMRVLVRLKDILGNEDYDLWREVKGEHNWATWYVLAVHAINYPEETQSELECTCRDPNRDIPCRSCRAKARVRARESDPVGEP